MAVTTPEDLRQLLIDHGLADHAEALAETAEPAVRLTAHRKPEADLAVGTSKFGGLPDLPEDTAWPTRGERPLAFLGQLDLATLPLDHLPGDPLPKTGLLSFWYDAPDLPSGDGSGDLDGFRVLWVPDSNTPLNRRPLPEFHRGNLAWRPHDQMGPPWGSFEACTLIPEPTITIEHETSHLAIREAASNAWDVLDELMDELNGDRDAPLHQLFGHPDPWEGGMLTRVHRLATGAVHDDDELYTTDGRAQLREAGVFHWRLLLQIDTDRDGPGWRWAKAGRLFFWIHRDSLARQDFSKIVGIMQSS